MNKISRVRLWRAKNSSVSNGIKVDEICSQEELIENVINPELIIYSPQETERRNIAIIICPGGGYSHLPIKLQGYDFAEWLTSIGITALVLKYRMPNGHKELPIEDANEALQYARNHASELSIDSNKIGIAGFSVGGHLAAMASNSILADNWHPAFTILFYPIITMGKYTHQSSRKNLLGENFTENDIRQFSCEGLVTSNTPPTLIFANDDDLVASTLNSILYYDSLKRNNVPASLYIFPQGGHAWGIKGKNANGEEFNNIDIVQNILKEWLLYV